MQEDGPVERTKESEDSRNQDTGEGIYPEWQVVAGSGLRVNVEHRDAWFAAVALLNVVVAVVRQFLLPLQHHAGRPVPVDGVARRALLFVGSRRRLKGKEKSTQN